MEIILITLTSVILTVAGLIFFISKKLKAEKLFSMSFLSSIVLTTTLTGLTVVYFDIELPSYVIVTKAEAESEQVYIPEDEPFAVKLNDVDIFFFETYKDAVDIAKQFGRHVYFRDFETIVWKRTYGIPNRVIQAPLFLQMPELPRGCEVTSLAMMLNYKGINVNKMELAERVRKDPTPYRVEDGTIYFGNPYYGFVGDMYSFDNPGYGVYHGPIRDLAEKYIPNQVIDMTGAEFEDILYPIHEGRPVWVIVHSQFKKLPETAFETWQTPTGAVTITYRQHSVLITGYDEKNIYFNDPLSTEVNRPISIDRFQAAWDQMGKQAISYVN